MQNNKSFRNFEYGKIKHRFEAQMVFASALLIGLGITAVNMHADANNTNNVNADANDVNRQVINPTSNAVQKPASNTSVSSSTTLSQFASSRNDDPIARKIVSNANRIKKPYQNKISSIVSNVGMERVTEASQYKYDAPSVLSAGINWAKNEKRGAKSDTNNISSLITDFNQVHKHSSQKLEHKLADDVIGTYQTDSKTNSLVNDYDDVASIFGSEASKASSDTSLAGGYASLASDLGNQIANDSQFDDRIMSKAGSVKADLSIASRDASSANVINRMDGYYDNYLVATRNSIADDARKVDSVMALSRKLLGSQLNQHRHAKSSSVDRYTRLMAKVTNQSSDLRTVANESNANALASIESQDVELASSAHAIGNKSLTSAYKANGLSVAYRLLSDNRKLVGNPRARRTKRFISRHDQKADMNHGVHNDDNASGNSDNNSSNDIGDSNNNSNDNNEIDAVSKSETKGASVNLKKRNKGGLGLNNNIGGQLHSAMNKKARKWSKLANKDNSNNAKRMRAMKAQQKKLNKHAKKAENVKNTHKLPQTSESQNVASLLGVIVTLMGLFVLDAGDLGDKEN